MCLLEIPHKCATWNCHCRLPHTGPQGSNSGSSVFQVLHKWRGPSGLTPTHHHHHHPCNSWNPLVTRMPGTGPEVRPGSESTRIPGWGTDHMFRSCCISSTVTCVQVLTGHLDSHMFMQSIVAYRRQYIQSRQCDHTNRVMWVNRAGCCNPPRTISARTVRCDMNTHAQPPRKNWAASAATRTAHFKPR